MNRIGIRELRQHASRYLAQVARGETIEVTDRGRLVARIVPVLHDPWDDLVASGLIHPPESKGHLLDEEAADYGVNASTNLAASRDTDR